MTHSPSRSPSTPAEGRAPTRALSGFSSPLGRYLTGLAVAITLPLTLAGCGEDDSVGFAPTCPAMHIPAEVADYYNYSAKGPSFDHLVTRASITHLGGDCAAAAENEKKKDLRTRVSVHMVVRRGPAATYSSLTLPWFVAVVHNDKIVGKHIFEQAVTFPDSASTVAVDTRLVTVDLPIKPTNGENDYRFEVGFQLTKTQLAYNREHGVLATFSGQ
ncbi:hypothetical protein [Acetobacter oeni]|uniref:Uncharacterized protein n=1 Tax=Acetobacter oeni TaxID=304077 RepID=A0A511XJG7_9PROT|nr:hypothetical protein [Acetobacter oeni]MBB3882750.1 hypothetical protein [Acetobacter oeni]GBR06473.1 hypothetical protein AA21952_2032 [Acetobacter oeni LMG 21952]GEN63061.1 hypothetical protein AOE01nite_12850 [Acetobacter oeni]